MPKTRPPYLPELRRQMVDLVRAGRDPADLAREFEPSAIAKRSVGEAAIGSADRGAIRNWVLPADRQEGGRGTKPAADPLATAQSEELARLRREVRQLWVERDILSKAAAWFARETGPPPSPVSFASGGACRADDIPAGDRKRWSSGS